MGAVRPFVARMLDLTRRGPLHWSVLNVFEQELSASSSPAETHRGSPVNPELEVKESGDHHPERFARGDLYLTLSRQGQVAGSTWLTTAGLWVSEARAFFVVNPGEVVIFDTFVDPVFRGQGLQNQLSAFATEVARKRGFRSVITYVDSLNLPSLRVQKKMGRRRTQRVLCLRMGSAAWCLGLNSPAAARFRK